MASADVHEFTDGCLFILEFFVYLIALTVRWLQNVSPEVTWDYQSIQVGPLTAFDVLHICWSCRHWLLVSNGWPAASSDTNCTGLRWFYWGVIVQCFTCQRLVMHLLHFNKNLVPLVTARRCPCIRDLFHLVLAPFCRLTFCRFSLLLYPICGGLASCFAVLIKWH